MQIEAYFGCNPNSLSFLKNPCISDSDIYNSKLYGRLIP